MAIAQTHLETTGSNTDASSYATGSRTPTANALQLLLVHAGGFFITSVAPTLSGNGLTWVPIADITYVAGDFDGRLTLFRALGTPSTGAVTIDFGGNTQGACHWSWREFTGVSTTGTDGSGAIAQAVPATATLTVTLDTFADAANATYGGFAADGPQAFTAGSGFTLNQDQRTSPNMTMCSEFKLANDTSVDVTFGGFTPRAGLAVEINASGVSGGGQGAVPVFASNYRRMRQRRRQV